MSTLKLDTLSNKAGTASVPSDTIVSGTAKAWVNFNGTGTVAIRRAFNVSSITDISTGDYRVNLTNAMSDANYAVVTGSRQDDTYIDRYLSAKVENTSSFRLYSANYSIGYYDSTYAYAAVFS